MKHIRRISVSEREILFRNTAEKCGMSPGIVEKDFWVCWTLDYLFHDFPWARNIWLSRAALACPNASV